MAEQKQTPMQFVKSVVPGAYSHKLIDGQTIVIIDQATSKVIASGKTPNAAWKNAADEIRLLEAKQEQARQFNEQASKPKPVEVKTTHGLKHAKPSEKPAPKIASLTKKEREKRKAKRLEARQKRKINRRRAA